MNFRVLLYSRKVRKEQKNNERNRTFGALTKNEDLIDEVTELVAEYAEKGAVIK